MSDEGQWADRARKNEGQSLDRPSVSAPEATDLMNKNEEGQTRPAAVMLAPGDGIRAPGMDTEYRHPSPVPARRLTSAVPAPAVTADVTESPEGGAEPDQPVEEPWSHMPTRALVAVRQHQAFPSFMRRYIDMAAASGPEMDQPRPLPEAHFMPPALRGTGTVAPSVTPSQPPPMAASVTPAVTVSLAAGSTCPTYRCRIPARLSAADRQRAYRKRQRDQGHSKRRLASHLELKFITL